MALPKGLKNSLNAIQQLASPLYHQYIPILEDDTDISKLAEPLFSMPTLYNEFCEALLQRIVYTQVDVKMFRNPLKGLEGSMTPMGFAGQEIYINPAKGRQYNANDFAGILQKYEADVKVQYLLKNMDLQYPVTIIRTKLKEAFVSWDALDKFIGGLTMSLYNGMYINHYRYTKALVSSAYKGHKAIIEQVSAINSEANAKAFIAKAREFFLNFQAPTTDYNAWSLNGGKGNPITTWSNPEDIVFLIKNSARAYMDVNVLASAFQMDKATLMGNIYPVDSFDVYSDDGEKIFDGSNIIGIMADRSWFKIKTVDEFMEEQRNANNRSIQYYLNDIRMYEYSLFANAVIFATALPTVDATEISFIESAPKVYIGKNKTLEIKTVPFQASNTISFSSASTGVASVEKVDDRHVKVTGVSAGTSVLTASCTNEAGETVSGTVTVTVSAEPIVITDLDFGVSSVTLDTTETLELTVTPTGGNTPVIEYSSSNEEVFTVEPVEGYPNKCTLTEVGAGSATLTATTGSVSAIVTVTVES